MPLSQTVSVATATASPCVRNDSLTPRACAPAISLILVSLVGCAIQPPTPKIVTRGDGTHEASRCADDLTCDAALRNFCAGGAIVEETSTKEIPLYDRRSLKSPLIGYRKELTWVFTCARDWRPAGAARVLDPSERPRLAGAKAVRTNKAPGDHTNVF